MSDDKSVQQEGLLSDERLHEWLEGQLHLFLRVERAMDREELARQSGVSLSMLDAMRKTGEGRRKPTMAIMLSLCVVMGAKRVNGLLYHIGYGGAKPLDEADAVNPHLIIASLLPHVSTIASAAADGRIDHAEKPLCRDAADQIIASVMPLSSAGDAA
jgi:DNA-binding Xre family transcriptional regulator